MQNFLRISQLRLRSILVEGCTSSNTSNNLLYYFAGSSHVHCLSQNAYFHKIERVTSSCSSSRRLQTFSTSVLKTHNHHSFLLQAPPSLLWPSIRTYAKNKGKDKGKDKGGKGQKKVKLTSDQLDGLVDMEKVSHDLDRVLEDLKDKFIHQVTVRTSHGVFNNLTVKTADGNFPLIQLGQVTQKSPQLVVINLAAAPQYISNVKEAFVNSGLNVNPQQDGTSLFVPIPKVTREHREGLAKNAKMLSEKSKKQLRDVYSKFSKKIKTSKDGHSADDTRAADDMVKDLMHDKLKQVDEMTELKRQELMGGK